jgi:hypothetical protein
MTIATKMTIQVADEQYILTTDHSQSSYGNPVLVSPSGTAYGIQDRLPNGIMAYIEVVGARPATAEESALQARFMPPFEGRPGGYEA